MNCDICSNQLDDDSIVGKVQELDVGLCKWCYGIIRGLVRTHDPCPCDEDPI